MRIAPPLLAVLLTGAPGSAAQDPAQEPARDVETPVDPTRAPLLAHKKLRQAMARLATEHSDLVTVLPLGWSRGERYDGRMQIEALRLAAGELVEGRPAILIVANLEGPLAYTSGIALDLCRSLAQGYAGDERIRALLDSTTILVLPRANPDSAEARFRRLQAEVRSSGEDADTDRDGLAGEDGRDDINGDGYVTIMRVPDPAGEWEEDPADPRVLRKADRKRGDRGVWKLVDEGRDSDGDGETSEDRPFDAEVNHNFAAGFEEHTPRAGLFPTSEPETRALCEFVMAHENIQLVLVYGELDNLRETPDGVADDAPAEKNIPPAGLRSSDAELVAEIGRRYRELAEAPAEGTGDDAGTFQRWCYEHRGLTTLTMNLWSIPLDSESDSKSDSESKSDSA
ncbi:MAG: M14 family zinc carboxypeptidase [Planctomycetota bacterium]